MDNAIDGDPPLTALHPNHAKALRVAGMLLAAPLLIGLAIAEIVTLAIEVYVSSLILLPLMALVAWAAIALPWRRYSASGYDMGADRLRVVKGVLFRRDTVVPFGRVQHIDLERGPIERHYGLATLKLHTAGTHNATIMLPGLGEADALAMREAIREKIGRDSQ
jgi:membrane protein YdbS with pleckstrin-like domain